MAREYEIYACTESDCDYYRDTLSTGRHVTGPELGERHGVEATVVVDKRDVEPLVTAARLIVDSPDSANFRNLLRAALATFEDSGGGE